EHVDAPLDLLDKVKKVLAPGGRVFVSVPNIASLQARIFRSRWFHLDPTRHMFHYTPETLTRLLEKAGFHVVRRTTASLEYGVFGWWQSFFNGLPMDFNMGYKVLKARKKYAPELKTILSLAVYAVLGLPLALLSLVLSLFETLLGHGGVIQVIAKTVTPL